MSFVSLSERLEAADGRPRGFDYMRLTLALMVIAIHSPMIAYADAGPIRPFQMPYLPVSRLVIPMFFALSGFLVAGSFERVKTYRMFFGLRAIRIFPALAVETFVSALVVGVLFTTLPLGQYFSDPLFFRYWLNILGEPQYHLPGVFLDNPLSGLVNLQLWTIPFELGCYISIAVIGVMGARQNKLVAPIAAILLSLAYLVFCLWRGAVPDFHRAMPGVLIIASFLWGVAAYQWRASLPGSLTAGGLALVASMTLLCLPGAAQFLAPLPIAYATAVLGAANPRTTFFSRCADYSYGLYLYGFPVQQALAAADERLRAPLVIFVLATAISGLVAVLSWNFVEKPAMRLRTPLKRWETSALEKRRRAQAEGALLPSSD